MAAACTELVGAACSCIVGELPTEQCEDHGRFPLRLVHTFKIHPPTPPMIAITAISRMASSTVYSINDAPSSSYLSCLISFMTSRVSAPLFALGSRVGTLHQATGIFVFLCIYRKLVAEVALLNTILISLHTCATRHRSPPSY